MKFPEERKRIAAELATLLPVRSQSEKVKALNLLMDLGYKDVPDKPVKSGEPYPEDYVGIYKPQIIGEQKHYIRDTVFKDRWSFFADLHEIPPKMKKKRVILLGESVARGFLLDPLYTPAIVLEKLLNANASNDKFEIIDLAETNLEMLGLKNRFKQCLALQPDVVILFAGNNWHQDYFKWIASDQSILEKVQRSISASVNPGDIKPVLEEIFSQMVKNFIDEIGNVTEQHQFPVVMMIPEFNLLDCRSTVGERAVTFLVNDGIKQWIASRDAAKAAQRENDIEEWLSHATQMIALDPSHPLGYEMSADAYIKQNNFDEARTLLERGRDTALFKRSNSKPRMFTVIRDTILKEASKYERICLVDLPLVFKKHFNGRIPGKEIFLDYCHFTVKGIQLAMNEVSEQVLYLTDNEHNRVLKPTDVKPSSDVIAMGHLFAAIHNMHWGQSTDILMYHCKEALKANKQLSRTMVYYCDMITRKAPNDLTKSLEMILTENTKIDRYVHALMHPNDHKIMETELVTAMIHALQTVGVNITNYISELRKNEHTAEGKDINLMQSYYHATSYDEYQGVRSACLQARDNESKFFIIADHGVGLNISISCRVPLSSEHVKNQPVKFLLNGTLLRSYIASNEWMSIELRLPDTVCKEGINELSIQWPVPEKVNRKIAVDGTPASLLTSIFYVFGEITQCSVTGVKDAVPVAEATA